MKSKNIVIIVVVLILLIGIGIWFWLGRGKEIEEGVVPSGEEKEEKVESLVEILGKAKGITSFKYDMVTIAPGESVMTTKMWWKEKKIRMEGTFEGRSMVYLVDVDKQLAYMYFPTENTAMKIDLARAQEVSGESPTEQSESIVKYNPVILGTETLDGKSCLVIEYTVEPVEVKMWVWKKYGLSVKTESTTDKGV